MDRCYEDKSECCGMKAHRATFSFTCFLTILVFAIFYIDINIRPRSTNSHVHIYYSYFPNRSRYTSREREVKFINIFNQSSASYLRTTTYGYYDDLTTTEPDLPASPSTSGSESHIIAIVSYMRSGSTLTADILQHFPGAMYVFEPFHTVFVRSRLGLPLFYLNGAVRKLKPENITNEVLETELKKWFECRFEELDMHSLTDDFHGSYSRSLKKFQMCWQSKPRTRNALKECLPLAIEKCKNAKYRLFKFIRLPMRVINSVKDVYPGLQTIHLIRDPRGSLSSQIKVNNVTWNDIGTFSKRFCERVADDMNSTIYLNHLYPDRAKILLYEKLAENPLTTAEKLHSFTKMPKYSYIRRYIHRLTMEGRKADTFYGSLRGNSTKAAYRWRDKIEFENVQTIDGNCADIYNFIGYRTFSSIDDVRNHSLSTLETPTSSLFI